MAEMRRKTAEEVSWLEEHVPKAPAHEVREAFRERFEWAPGVHALQVWASKRGLRFGRWGDPAQNRAVHIVRWSQEPEMEAWMLENDQGRTTGEISRMFEVRFGFPLSQAQVSLFRSSHGTQSRRSHGGGHPSVPVGTERASKDGYLKVKVREKPIVPQSKDNWQFKHWIAWEEANGQEVPEGWTVLFVDGDTRNFAPDNLYALDQSALLDIGTGQENAAKPPLARHSHKRQHAPYPAQRAVERELADEHRSVGHTSIDLPGRGENGYGYRQIVERPLLAQIGRSKVHDDLLGRHAQLRIFECRAYALLALLDRAVGQADEIEPYAAGSDIGFDGNVESFDAREGTRMNLGEHRYIILYCIVV